MADEDTVVQRVARARPRGRPMWAYLSVLSGRQVGAVYRVGTGVSILGRGSEAGLKLVDEGVSRRHAKLIRDGDGTTKIVDLQSTNGTFVNGRRVDIEPLREGDRVRIGKSATLDFRYEYSESDESCEAAELADSQPYPANDPHHEASITSLRRVYRSRRQYTRALEAYERTLAIREESFGPEHPAVAAILDTMASLQRDNGEFAGALGHQRRALEIYARGAQSGEEPPELAHLLTNMGETQLALGSPVEALQALERALGLLEARRADDSELAPARFGIARALNSLSRAPVRSRTLARLAREGFAEATNGADSVSDVDRFLDNA